MAPIDKYCLVAEREGRHKIINHRAIYTKKGKKWIHPKDSTMQNNVAEFYYASEGGAEKRLLKVVAVGELNELKAMTVADDKRVKVHKRQTFSPLLTKTKPRDEGKKLRAAERKAFAKAQDDAQRSADRIYSDMVSTSKRKKADYGESDSSQVSHHETTPISARVQTPVSGRVQTPVSGRVQTPVSGRDASMPRSLTCYDLNPGSALSTPARAIDRRVSRIRHPYVAMAHTGRTDKVTTSQSSDALVSSIREALHEASKSLIRNFQESVGNLQNAVVAQLLKIHTDLGVIRTKLVTVNDIEGILTEREYPASRSEVARPEEEPDNVQPDADGMVEVIPGVQCPYETYTAALLAKTLRRRANLVFKMLWPDSLIKTLYVGRGPSSRHRAQSTPTTTPESLGTRDYLKINAVCDALQRAKEVPVRTPGDSVRANVRSWAADWLKNRRYRMSKLKEDDSVAEES